MIEENSQPDEKAEVTDAIGDECFDRRVGGGFLFVPEADQQIRAEADQFPEDKELKNCPTEHQSKHGKAEEAEIGEKSRKSFVIGHIGDGKDVNQRGHQRDHGEHHDGEAVNVNAHFQKRRLSCRVAGGRPVERQVNRKMLLNPVFDCRVFPRRRVGSAGHPAHHR